VAVFQDRAQRVAARFLVQLDIVGESVQGECINISESGMLVRFTQILELWTVGEASLHFAGGVVALKVRVARVLDFEAGLSFLFSNEDQRATVAVAVASAWTEMRKQGHAVQVPF
jgi:hypothetical protein